MSIFNRKLTWLLKREMWEHKGGFIQLPLVVGAAWVLIFGIASVFSDGPSQMLLNASESITGYSSIHYKFDIIAQFYLFIATPIPFILAFSVFFFSLGTLFDERQDRSLLFWKSLPISDEQTVASKAILALVIAPIIAFATTIATGLLCLLAASIGLMTKGVNLFPVFAEPDLYLNALRLLALLPIYFLSALPTVGWLMLVGAISRSKPFLWGTLLPVMLMVSGWVNNHLSNGDTEWTTSVAGNLLLGTLPLSWLWGDYLEESFSSTLHQENTTAGIFESSMAVVSQPEIWLWAIIGLGMLAGASILRRKTES